MGVKEIKELMSGLGFTTKQSEVYLELLKTPGQSAGTIAKMLSIDRSFAYGILNSLAAKGMVSHLVKENKRVFYASDPENIMREIDERRGRISDLVGELKAMKAQSKDERSVKIYEGKPALKAFIRDVMASGEFYTMGGGGKLNILETLKYQYPQYLKEISEKKIRWKLITSPENARVMKDLMKISNISIKKMDGLKSHVNFVIFRNKMVIYSAEEKPLVIEIEDKKISEALRAYFDILWNIDD